MLLFILQMYWKKQRCKAMFRYTKLGKTRYKSHFVCFSKTVNIAILDNWVKMVNFEFGKEMESVNWWTWHERWTKKTIWVLFRNGTHDFDRVLILAVCRTPVPYELSAVKWPRTHGQQPWVLLASGQSSPPPGVWKVIGLICRGLRNFFLPMHARVALISSLLGKQILLWL